VATGTQPAYFKVADGTPTCTTSDLVLGSNVVDYITVTPGQKCAALQGGTAGTIAITEMS